jgi:hypothetical protein
LTPSRASGRVFHGLPEWSFKDPKAGGGKPVVESGDLVALKRYPLGAVIPKKAVDGGSYPRKKGTP